MIEFIKDFVFISVGVLVAARVVPGVHIKANATAFLVGFVYSIVHFLFFKILLFLSFPLVFITLGLFTIIINACLLWLTDKMLDGFEIQSFGWTVVASLVISIISLLLGWIFAWV